MRNEFSAPNTFGQMHYDKLMLFGRILIIEKGSKLFATGVSVFFTVSIFSRHDILLNIGGSIC